VDKLNFPDDINVIRTFLAHNYPFEKIPIETISEPLHLELILSKNYPLENITHEYFLSLAQNRGSLLLDVLLIHGYPLDWIADSFSQIFYLPDKTLIKLFFASKFPINTIPKSQIVKWFSENRSPSFFQNLLDAGYDLSTLPDYLQTTFHQHLNNTLPSSADYLRVQRWWSPFITFDSLGIEDTRLMHYVAHLTNSPTWFCRDVKELLQLPVSSGNTKFSEKRERKVFVKREQFYRNKMVPKQPKQRKQKNFHTK